MTERQISIIKDSWKYVADNVEKPYVIFYDRLFTLDPSLKSLFPNDMDKQGQKLITTISYVVDNCHDLEAVIDDVRALGRRHVGYNVKKEHYDTVGAALLWTLEQALKEQWTEEVKETWTAVYTTLANVMIEASAEISEDYR